MNAVAQLLPTEKYVGWKWKYRFKKPTIEGIETTVCTIPGHTSTCDCTTIQQKYEGMLVNCGLEKVARYKWGWLWADADGNLAQQLHIRG